MTRKPKNPEADIDTNEDPAAEEALRGESREDHKKKEATNTHQSTSANDDDDDDGDIIHRSEDAYEREANEDSEKIMFKIRASRGFIAMQVLMSLLMGTALGWGARYVMREKFHMLSMTKWGTLINICTFAPPAIFGIISLFTAVSRLSSRYEVSRRFIRMERFFGLAEIDSCDMTQVTHVQLIWMGPVCNIKVHTRDKDKPEIIIALVPTKLAKKVYGYMTAHALNTYAEIKTSRRLSRRG